MGRVKFSVKLSFSGAFPKFRAVTFFEIAGQKGYVSNKMTADWLLWPGRRPGLPAPHPSLGNVVYSFVI
jgi:hypothetical protein